MEIIERYENDLGGYDEYYRDSNSDPELDRMLHDAYMREALERYSHLQRVEDIQQKSPYIFLTINPNPHITLNDFIKTCEKMMSKPWIEKYLYCFEQRGETLEDCGKGFHFHAIIEKPSNKSYKHIIREMASSANRLCDTSNYHFYNLKNISIEEKERKIVYITGKKADEAKHKKQEMDIPFREKNKLKSYYNIGII